MNIGLLALAFAVVSAPLAFKSWSGSAQKVVDTKETRYNIDFDIKEI